MRIMLVSVVVMLRICVLNVGGVDKCVVADVVGDCGALCG